MSFPDYRRFTLNRELFPRHEQYSTNRLICGHLNRVKFAPSIPNYIKARAQGLSMRKSMARASRCFCRPEDSYGKRDSEGEMSGPESKMLIKKL